jgi:hypothetical protein
MKSTGFTPTWAYNESKEVILNHTIALFGTRTMAYTRKDPRKLVIELESIDEKGNRATFIHTNAPGLTSTKGPEATCGPRWVSFGVSSQFPYSQLSQFRIDEVFWTSLHPSSHTDSKPFVRRHHSPDATSSLNAISLPNCPL